MTTNQPRYAPALAALVDAPETRFVLSRAALAFDQMDPVDAVDDCEALLALMRLRLNEAFAAVRNA